MKIQELIKGIAAGDCIGALVNMGADAILIEDIETAEDVSKQINEKQYHIEIPFGTEDFETACKRLDLTQSNEPKRIFYAHNFNEEGILICFADDWHFTRM